jgi:glutamate 5-kinase
VTINFSSFIGPNRSQFGRGGMITKSNMAQKVAALGIAVHIANGTRDNVLTDILENKVKHTHFHPDKTKSGKKKWLAHSENYATGVVQVNDGAKTALASNRATSLLPVGLIKVIADFKKGDIIKLVDAADKLIGLGIAEYSAEKAREKIGLKNQKPLVHYDYLYLQG